MDYEEGTRGWIYVCDESAVWVTVITENTVRKVYFWEGKRKQEIGILFLSWG
jgi:dTDP-D-glucose 4,6-dehydratase